MLLYCMLPNNNMKQNIISISKDLIEVAKRADFLQQADPTLDRYTAVQRAMDEWSPVKSATIPLLIGISTLQAWIITKRSKIIFHSTIDYSYFDGDYAMKRKDPLENYTEWGLMDKSLLHDFDFPDSKKKEEVDEQ